MIRELPRIGPSQNNEHRGSRSYTGRMSNQTLPSAQMKEQGTWLYPPIEPYRTGRLQVSPVHELYFEESGNPSGKPVVFLHGGPGGGSDPKQRRFFHPEKYRIICFDQRGCGKSIWKMRMLGRAK